MQPVAAVPPEPRTKPHAVKIPKSTATANMERIERMQLEAENQSATAKPSKSMATANMERIERMQLEAENQAVTARPSKSMAPANMERLERMQELVSYANTGFCDGVLTWTANGEERT